MNLKKFLLVASLLGGCVANVQTPTCEDAFIGDPSVEPSHRIMPSYVETFGCETFEDMSSYEDFSDFCMMQFPETEGSFAADVIPGCRVGEDRCEWFWICE